MGIWVNEYSFSDYTVLYALIVSKKSCRHLPIRAFVCAYHPAVPSSNPNRTIYVLFINYFVHKQREFVRSNLSETNWTINDNIKWKRFHLKVKIHF